MPSKDIIEVNKLKIGSSGATGIYVGSSESKYAVLTDSAASPTVIYDKVKYDFSVNDLTGTVPASGGTYNVTATSKKTHGNGSTGSVAYNPTQVVVPANTGSSYSSAVTITQNTSNLTDAYNFNVAADSVKSIALTISNPATIPAAGGSVSTCTTAATVTYHSGRVVTSFTPTSVNFNTVSAATKGTTVSDITTAGTLTCYIVYGGVTSNTASVYVKQAANAVTSYTDYQAPTGMSISASKVPASGGTSTITWSGTCKQDAKAVYTSTATASTYTNLTVTPTKSVSGNSAVASKGSTISNETTAIATVTGTYTANGKSSTTTTSVKQNANYVTKVEATGSSSTSHFSYSNITAGATSASITGTGAAYYTFTSGSRVLDSSSSPSFGGSATYTRSNFSLSTSQNGFTAVNSSNGTLTATSRGTTIGNARTSGTVTGRLVVSYTHASSYSAGGTVTSANFDSTATCTQAGNYVTGIAVSSIGVAYEAIPAAGGSKTPTGSNGTVTYTFSSTSTSTTKPDTTYGDLTSSVTYSMTNSGRFTLKSASTGEVSATTKGTTVETITSSDTVSKTVSYTWTPTASYNAAGTKTTSGAATTKATQAANAIVSYTDYGTPTGKSISGSQVPAAGGTSTITWSGTPAQTRKPVYTSTSTGSTESFTPTISTAVTGNNAVATKGTTVSDVTTAQTVTGYYWANGKTASTTCYVTQAANAIVFYTDYGTPTGKSISGSQVPASGGTSTITWSGTPAQTRKPVYTSTATGSTVSYTPTISTAITGNNAVASKGTTVSNATTAQTVTGYYWANGKTASTTCYVTQAANTVTGYVDYQTPTGKSISGSQVPAAGGTSTITWSGTAAQNAKAVYTSTATASTYTNVAPSVSTAVTGNSAVSSKGTTASNATTALTVTGYYWANGKTASTSCYVTQAKNEITNSDYSKNNYAATVSIGNGLTAAGGSATVTYNASHYGYDYYSSGSYNNNHIHYDQAKVEITSNGNSRFSMTTVCGSTASNTTTLSHSTMGTSATTDSVTVKCTNMADTSKTATASKDVVNKIESTKYNEGDSAYTATISIGNGITAAGGSATVTASASHTHYWQQKYTSGSYVTSWYTSNVSDTANVTEDSDPNNRYSYSNGTLTHSSMGTYVGTDSCTLRVRNASNTATTNTASVSATNAEGTTEMNAGNSAWTATISIGNGITAGGGSATVTANASHVHYYRHQYTSGSYTGWYTPTVTDTADVTEDSDPNSRYSYASGTLTHSSMGTYVGTDSCTLRVINHSNTATTNTTSVSVSNAEGTTEMNAGNSAWTATISIGNGITAAGGSATVTANASHVHYYRHQYTSGSYTGWYTPTVTDTADVTEDSDPNSRYSYSNGTLSHSSMGTYVGTDSCTLRVRNHSNTGTTNTATVSATNAEGTTEMNAGNSAWTATVSIGDGMTAAGGSATVSHSAGHTHYYRHQYTSGSYTGWYTSAVSDTSTISITSNGNSAFTLNGNTLSHSNMTTNARTDSVTITVKNSNNTSTTNTASKSITNAITNSNYDPQSYWASISIGSGISAGGGSATVTASAGHSARNLYTSGSYSGLGDRSDGVTVTEVSDPNSRYSYSNGTLSHSSMGKNETTDSCTLRATNNANSSATKDASTSVSNSATWHTEGYSGRTASVSVASGSITAGGGSVTLSTSSTRYYYGYYSYTSGSRTPDSGYQRGGQQTNQDGVTLSLTTNGNSRYTLNGLTLSHSSMGTDVTTDYWVVTATNNNDSSATGTASGNVSNAVTNSNYDAQNYTASISIGSGLSAAGGSATVTASAGHQARNYYTSGSYSGLGSRTDSVTWEISSNGNSRFSKNGNTLSHSSMGTNATTDTVYVKATNSSNTSATAQTSTSIVNEVTNSNYDAQSYWASATIGSGLSAAGGSATVTASAGHQARYYYTSGSYTGLAARTDTATWAISSNGNSRFSQNGNTLNHSSMGTSETTDTVKVKATNSSNSSATGETSASVTNTRTRTDGNSGYTASISIGSGLSAGGGSATVSASGSHTYWYYDSYTSGSRVPSSGVNTSTQSDGASWEITSNGNNRFSKSSNTLSHSSMGTNATTDTVYVKATNSNNSSATAETSTSIVNQVTNSDYDAQSYWASVTIGSGLSAAGGSATVSPSAGHSARYYYTSGSYSDLGARTDSATWEISSNGNNRFSKNGNTLSHSSMGTNATTDTVYVKATNSSNTSATGQAYTSIVNQVTNSNYDARDYWASITIGGGITAGGGSASVSASAGHSARYYYTSGSYSDLGARSDGVTVTEQSDNNNRYSYSNGTLTHSSMGTSETTDICTLRATNNSSSSAYKDASVSVTNYRTRTDGNSGYTASISIGYGLSAGGGSATVSASGSHTYWYYDSYTSGSRVPTSGVNTSSKNDGASWEITSNGNNRFSKSNNTLSHSSMGTNETTDTVYVKATNSNNSGATAQTYTSITNSRTRYDGNSGYTASISIGNGITAAGGSASVTASAGHTYWYYDSYTSGSRNPSSGANTSSQSDGVTVTEQSDNNNRYSYSNGTLSHSNMTTNATTDSCTLRATNNSSSSTYKDASVSVTNSITATSNEIKTTRTPGQLWWVAEGDVASVPTPNDYGAYMKTTNTYTSGSVSTSTTYTNLSTSYISGSSGLYKHGNSIGIYGNESTSARTLTANIRISHTNGTTKDVTYNLSQWCLIPVIYISYPQGQSLTWQCHDSEQEVEQIHWIVQNCDDYGGEFNVNIIAGHSYFGVDNYDYSSQGGDGYIDVHPTGTNESLSPNYGTVRVASDIHSSTYFDVSLQHNYCTTPGPGPGPDPGGS